MTKPREFQVFASRSGNKSVIQVMVTVPGVPPRAETLVTYSFAPRAIGEYFQLEGSDSEPLMARYLDSLVPTEIEVATGDGPLYHQLVRLTREHWGATDPDEAADAIMQGVQSALQDHDGPSSTWEPSHGTYL